MAGKARRVGIVRIDFVPDLRRESAGRWIGYTRFSELRKSGLPVEKADCHAEWRAEFCSIGRLGISFGFERLPETVHGPLRHLANDVNNVVQTHPLPAQ